MSETSSLLAMVDTKIDHPTKPDSSTAGRVLQPCSATPTARGVNKLQGLNIIRESQLEASEPALDRHQVVNGLRQEDRLYYHLFHNFTAYANSEVFQARAIINLGTT